MWVRLGRRLKFALISASVVITWDVQDELVYQDMYLPLLLLDELPSFLNAVLVGNIHLQPAEESRFVYISHGEPRNQHTGLS